MKRLLVFIFFFFIFSFSYCQDLIVRDFFLDERNLLGSTYQRTDTNGDFCSLIIVQSNLQGCGMSFLGDIVGKVEEKDGDYWVYVTSETKRLKVKCPNYIPLDIDFKTYNIGKTYPKMTYILNVIGTNAITPKLETKIQRFTIKYSPANAVVKINNEDMEASNGLFKTKYPIGKYTYEISAPGYVTQKEIVDLSATSPTDITISLKTMTQLQEVQHKQTEKLLEKGKMFLHLGDDKNAEDVAVKCVKLGNEDGYEIITALQLLGYYDDGNILPVSKMNLEQWQMKRYHVSGKDLLEKRYKQL